MAKKQTKKKVAKTTTKKVKRKVKATAVARKKKATTLRSTTKKKKAVVAKAKITSKAKTQSNTKAKAKRVSTSSASSSAGGKRKAATAKPVKSSKVKKALTMAKKTVKGKSAAKKTSKLPSKNAAKASLPPATSQDPIQFIEEVKRTPKTKLSRKELNEFKRLLLAKRSELTGDVANISFGVNNRNGIGGDHGNMPIHMADIGSDNWEHEFTLGLLANEHERIRQIDDALLRIADRTYGVCLATHNPISNARLLAKPWAKYSIDYARAREEGRAI